MDNIIEQHKITAQRAAELNISLLSLDDNKEYENPYKIEALIYLENFKEVPDELKAKIKEFELKHTKRKLKQFNNMSNNAKKKKYGKNNIPNISYTAEQLSKMSLQELEEIYNKIEHPSYEQKERALKQLDTGIYDSEGNLIGDKYWLEDEYTE